MKRTTSDMPVIERVPGKTGAWHCYVKVGKLTAYLHTTGEWHRTCVGPDGKLTGYFKGPKSVRRALKKWIKSLIRHGTPVVGGVVGGAKTSDEDVERLFDDDDGVEYARIGYAKTEADAIALYNDVAERTGVMIRPKQRKRLLTKWRS